MDFFASKGAPSSVQDAQMKGGLQTLVDRLKHNGTLVIVDIEKTHPESQAYEAQLDDAHYNQAKVDGKKLHGFGSKEICRFGANRCS